MSDSAASLGSWTSRLTPTCSTETPAKCVLSLFSFLFPSFDCLSAGLRSHSMGDGTAVRPSGAGLRQMLRDQVSPGFFPAFKVRRLSSPVFSSICLATAIEEKFPDLHPLTFQCCLSTPCESGKSTFSARQKLTWPSKVSHKGKRSVSRKPFYWKPEVVATSALLHEIDPVEARTDRRKAHPSQAALDLQREFDEYQEAVKNDVEVFAKCADRVEKQRLKDEKERPRLRFRQCVPALACGVLE